MQLPLQGAANCAGTNFTQGAASLALGYVQLGLQPAIVNSRYGEDAVHQQAQQAVVGAASSLHNQQPCMGYGALAVPPNVPYRKYTFFIHKSWKTFGNYTQT